MFESMAQHEYRAESHVTDRLERENAQLKAVIAEQVDVVTRYFKQNAALTTECREQTELIEKLRLAYADSVIESGEKAELIEKLAEALKGAIKYDNRWNVDCIEALDAYAAWKDSK